jgi:hypothetical protein
MVMTFGRGWSGSPGGRPWRSWRTHELLLVIASSINQLRIVSIGIVDAYYEDLID